jgi:hypothetical protein
LNLALIPAGLDIPISQSTAAIKPTAADVIKKPRTTRLARPLGLTAAAIGAPQLGQLAALSET